MDIRWKTGEIPASERPRLEDALNRLVDPEGPQRWRISPGWIEVLSRLSGFGGGLVLQIAVYWHSPPALRVVKIGLAEEMHREYHAHETVAMPERSILFTPIETATSNARAQAAPADVRRTEAVVYQDVGQYTGAAGAPVTTLEDIFAAASLGDSDSAKRTTAAITKLFALARQSLYLARHVGDLPASLRAENTRLGPDITVEPGAATQAHTPRWPGDLFNAGTADPWEPRTPDVPHSGDLIVLESFEARDKDGIRLAVSDAQHVSAEILPAPGPAVIPFSGRVVATRPQTTRERILRHLGDPVHEPQVRRALAALRPALDTCLPAIVSAVHGDLNSRNILLVDETPSTDPYLIDYARARTGGSLLSDFAWLEINLVRAIQGDPGLGGHVRLQRFLAATASLFPWATGPGPGAVPETLTEHLRAGSEGLAICWPVLHRLRWESFITCPEAARNTWFTDYQRHLVMAAHRTFKWPDPMQTRARWTASTAVASVAGEWLDTDNALRHWTDDELTALAASAPGFLGRAGGARLLGMLSAETDRRTAPGTPSVGTLVEAANAVAAGLAGRWPAQAEVRPFLDLLAEVVTADGATTRDSALTAIVTHDFAVLAGPYGSGKSTVIAELAARMTAVARLPGNVTDVEWHRLPVLIPASALTADGDGIENAVDLIPAPTARDLLRAGCLHLFVDGEADHEVDVLARAAAVRRRYPRTPILVATGSAPEGEAVAGTVIRLLAPTTAQAIGFLTETAAHRGIPVSAVRRLLTGPVARRTDELLHLPMLLRLLADNLRPEVPAPGIGDLLDRHFADGDAAWGRARRVAGDLAAHLVDHEADAADDAAWPHGADWPKLRDLLIDRQVLHRTTAGTGFTRPIYRDYFAATTIRAESMPRRARRLAWQEPLRIAMSRRASPGGLLAALLPLVDAADPVFAGRLLHAAPEVDHESTRSFVGRRGAVLADPQAGAVAVGRAAAALLSLGASGHRLLCVVAADNRYDPIARLAALRALGSAGSASDEALRLLSDMLTGPAEPAELRVAAVTVAGQLRATRLAVLIADGCDADAPWEYIRAAHTALVSMGVTPSPKIDEERRAAARRRLDEATRILPGLTSWDEIDSAQRDREEIITRILGDDHERLLRHRFGFDLDEAVGEVLQQASGRPSADVAALLAGFGDGDERVSTAAAHALLAFHPDRADALVADVTPTDRPARLLAAASAGMVAGPTVLPYLEDLARALAAQPADDTRTEPLAALIWTVSRLNETRGAHLARHVRAVMLAADDPRRLFWPISVAIAKSTPSPLVREGLLSSADPESRALAIEALATQGFHLDASPPPADTATEAGRQVLRAARPAPEATWAAVEFVRACATARLVDSLDFVLDLLDQAELATMVRTVPHSRFGVLSLAGLSEVLTAAGFLARAALDATNPSSIEAATAVAARIEDLDPTGLHPSVAAGRLIALGYLGDPGPLLAGLDGAEPRLHTAAGHAVLSWGRSGSWQDPHRSANVVAELLHTQTRSGAARSTLLTVLDALCRRSGQLPDPSGHGPM
ncbi:hypothetical protein HerbRD11066_17490 [Herbidospora sp. RD11066]